MATVTASYTWVSGETVTPAKLNSAAAPTVVVADNEITTSKLLDGNVTNAKLASGIDASKLTTGTLPADRIGAGAITTPRILNANVTPAKLSQPLTLATSQATTSGTSIDFTGIPSWVKRITVMFNGVSTNGTTAILVRVGAGAPVVSSGYVGAVCNLATTSSYANISSGFNIGTSNAAAAFYDGIAVLARNTDTLWNYNSQLGRRDFAAMYLGAGSINIGQIDRVRLTTVNGTDTFDAGSVNIMYEG
jgi:hypothetical protein